MSSEHHSRFNLSTVDGSNIESYLQGLKPIDLPGMDSIVFRYNDWVFKKYFSQPMDKILLYQQVTDLAASNAYSYATQIKGLGRTQLVVEPVAKVLQSEQTGLVYGISRFAQGPRPKDDKITELTELLEQFTTDMRQRLGFKGIHIIASNTKLKPGLIPFSGSTCNITDICTSIAELTRI